MGIELVIGNPFWYGALAGGLLALWCDGGANRGVIAASDLNGASGVAERVGLSFKKGDLPRK